MDREVILNLKRFKIALESNGIKVKKMIVYGSHAQGKAKIYSDVDVVVISNDFKRLNLLRRLEVLGSILAKAKIMAPIEALGYTETEFSSKEKGTFLGDEIKAKGKAIKI